MAKWIASIFGYEKLRTNGWERRARPGDIISFKPFGEDYTDHEKRHRLIVTIDGPTKSQMQSLCEPYWDTMSYTPYNPMDYSTWETHELDGHAQRDTLDRWDLLTPIQKAEQYAEYLSDCRLLSETPNAIHRKRRFELSVDLLKSLGVDEDRMNDRADLYIPKIRNFSSIEAFDKLKDRNVKTSDGLNRLKRRTLEEMQDAREA